MPLGFVGRTKIGFCRNPQTVARAKANIVQYILWRIGRLDVYGPGLDRQSDIFVGDFGPYAAKSRTRFFTICPSEGVVASRSKITCAIIVGTYIHHQEENQVDAVRWLWCHVRKAKEGREEIHGIGSAEKVLRVGPDGQCSRWTMMTRSLQQYMAQRSQICHMHQLQESGTFASRKTAKAESARRVC